MFQEASGAVQGCFWGFEAVWSIIDVPKGFKGFEKGPRDDPEDFRWLQRRSNGVPGATPYSSGLRSLTELRDFQEHYRGFQGLSEAFQGRLSGVPGGFRAIQIQRHSSGFPWACRSVPEDFRDITGYFIRFEGVLRSSMGVPGMF